MVQAVLTDHLHHWAVNAARASEDGGQARLGEVARTIRQVIRLKDLSRTPAQPAALPEIPPAGTVSTGTLG
jgi:hypothetical protein